MIGDEDECLECLHILRTWTLYRGCNIGTDR